MIELPDRPDVAPRHPKGRVWLVIGGVVVALVVAAQLIPRGDDTPSASTCVDIPAVQLLADDASNELTGAAGSTVRFDLVGTADHIHNAGTDFATIADALASYPQAQSLAQDVSRSYYAAAAEMRRANVSLAGQYIDDATESLKRLNSIITPAFVTPC